MSGRTVTLPGVERFVAVASLPRTGSNLVCLALGATGQVPTPQEWMNPKAFDLYRPSRPAPRRLTHRRAVRRIGRMLGVDSWTSVPRYSSAAMHRFVLDTVPAQTSTDGTATLKVMWSHYQEGLLECGLGLERLEVPLVWIRTTRRDRLGQAVSFARALSTWQWTSNASSSKDPEYDAEVIDRCLRTIDTGERGWDDYFAALGVTPLEVVYEDLDREYETVMSSVLQHCGIDAPVPPRQLERQRDSTNAEWIARYRSERGLDRN